MSTPQQASALQRLKEARARSKGAPPPPPPPQQQQPLASNSDAANEAYLAAFAAALHSGCQLSDAASCQPPRGAGRLQNPTDPARHTPSQQPASTAGKQQSLREQQPVHTWRTGPVDAAGVLVQVSDRPLLCSCSVSTAADGSIGGGDVVVGSSDHALYVVDANTGRKKRTLYSKSTGHTEWVTSVCCLPGEAVLSGGMDGRLWLWPAAAGAAATEIRSAHDAPVSKVAALPQPAAAAAAAATLAHTRSSTRPAVRGSAAGGSVLAASCSYDKTVKLWQVSGGRTAKQVATMSGHPGPVLELAVAPSGDLLLTGDRRGGLMAWDVTTASNSWGVKDAHAGHITALAWQQQQVVAEQPVSSSSNVVALSGGQDGCLRAWDARVGSCVARQQVHAGAQGKGAVGSIVTVDTAGGRQLVVTAGADKTLRVCDPAASYTAVATVPLTDFPYALAAVGDGLVVCGCGDGSVHVVDAAQGTTLYVLGAGRAAVRCLDVVAAPSHTSLVCAGDDGCVVAYRFV